MANKGSVGDLVNSCNGVNACTQMGFSGRVGNLEDSCNEEYACLVMGYSGSVGDLVDSCFGVGACYGIAKYGSVGDIKKSCNGNGEEFVSRAPSTILSPTLNLCHIRNLQKRGSRANRHCDRNQQLLQCPAQWHLQGRRIRRPAH